MFIYFDNDVSSFGTVTYGSKVAFGNARAMAKHITTPRNDQPVQADHQQQERKGMDTSSAPYRDRYELLAVFQSLTGDPDALAKLRDLAQQYLASQNQPDDPTASDHREPMEVHRDC